VLFRSEVVNPRWYTFSHPPTSTQSPKYRLFCCEQGPAIVTAISASLITGGWPECSISLLVYCRIAMSIMSFSSISAILPSFGTTERMHPGAAQYRFTSELTYFPFSSLLLCTPISLSPERILFMCTPDVISLYDLLNQARKFSYAQGYECSNNTVGYNYINRYRTQNYSRKVRYRKMVSRTIKFGPR